MKVLLTGFEPFGGEETNPSQELIEELQKLEFSCFHVETLILPVTFNESFSVLKEKIDELEPNIVISFGVANNRDKISLESKAHNFIDAPIPDNNNEQPSQQKIIDSEVEYIESGLPLFEIQSRLKTNFWPVEISNDAGGYVCNYLMFKNIILSKKNGYLAGFVHIPRWEHFKKVFDIEISTIKRNLAIEIQQILLSFN